jgi:hypothetical protein
MGSSTIRSANRIVGFPIMPAGRDGDRPRHAGAGAAYKKLITGRFPGKDDVAWNLQSARY